MTALALSPHKKLKCCVPQQETGPHSFLQEIKEKKNVSSLSGKRNIINVHRLSASNLIPVLLLISNWKVQ